VEIGVLDGVVRAHLGPGAGIDDDNHPIQHSGRSGDFTDEIRVSGMVDKVNAVFLPVHMGQLHGDGVVVLDFLLQVISHRGTSLNAADATDHARIKKNVFEQKRLARSPVPRMPTLRIREGSIMLMALTPFPAPPL
jgi:hypothetical protein